MRLVGSTRKVSRVCNERFSWAGTGGRLWRGKLGIMAGLLKITSLDGFADMYGPKWAYHLAPAIAVIELPYYENMKLAKLNGWNLVNDHGESWPFPDLTLPAGIVGKSHLQAYVMAKEILFKRQGFNPDRKRFVPYKPKPAEERLQPVLKSWLDYTAGDN